MIKTAFYKDGQFVSYQILIYRQNFSIKFLNCDKILVVSFKI